MDLNLLTSLDYLTSDTYNIICFLIIGIILIFIGIVKRGNMMIFTSFGILFVLFPFVMPYSGQAVTTLFLKEEAVIKDEPKLYYKEQLKPISEEYPDVYIADDGYAFIYRPDNLQQISIIDRWGANQFYEHKNGDEYILNDNVNLTIGYTNESPYYEVYTYSSESKFQNYLLNNPRTFKPPVYVKLYINSDNQIARDFSFNKSLLKGVNFSVY